MDHRLTRTLAAVCAVVAVSVMPAGTAQAAFTEISPTNNPWITGADEDFWIMSAAPADVDGDGDVDLAVLGYYVVYFGSVEDRLEIFLNDGPDGSGRWMFTQAPAPLGSLWASASDLAWGDCDDDGDPDLVVATEGGMILLRNDAGALQLTDTILPEYAEDSGGTSAYDLRSITWADADNDGDLDLFVPSVPDRTTFTYTSLVLRNDGPNGSGGVIFTDMAAGIDPTLSAQSFWADDDGDLDLDLFVANVDNWFDEGFVRRFRNDGGSFTANDILEIRINFGMADWCDYDCDDDLDIVVAGNIQETDGTYATVLRIYRNDGAGYGEIPLFGDWLDLNAVTWADYDSDGDIDLLVTGSLVDAGEIVGRSTIYANDGGVLGETGIVLPAPFSSSGGGGAFTWFDVDGDRDLDYFVTGEYFVPGGNGLVETQMHLYLNEPGVSHFGPSAPMGLGSAPSGSGVLLSWNAAFDDRTPTPALTYDLEVRSIGAVRAPNLRLPEPGNLGATTSWALQGLLPGTYAWSVCAIDNSLASGPRSEGTFTIGGGTIDPPVVPDGRRAAPLRVAKLDPSGAALAVAWDSALCAGAVTHELLFGFGSRLPPAPGGVFALAGAECGVATPFTWSPSPDASLDPTGLAWFVVVATNGADTEGSWGADSRGMERSGPAAGGASGACGVLQKSLANTCGR